MAHINVILSLKNAWQLIFEKCNHSVIFIDDVYAESLHWAGGASLLIQSGSVDIKRFSSFEVVLNVKLTNHVCCAYYGVVI